MRRCLTVLAVAATGCLTDSRAARDRGAGGLFENVPIVQAPVKKRCLGRGKNHARCDEAEYLADVYVKKLSPGDMVCLEGGFGDEPRGDCLCRAEVADTATDRLLLELREAKPDSRWFKKESNQYWFEEGALVDLYLAEHGY